MFATYLSLSLFEALDFRFPVVVGCSAKSEEAVAGPEVGSDETPLGSLAVFLRDAITGGKGI